MTFTTCLLVALVLPCRKRAGACSIRVECHFVLTRRSGDPDLTDGVASENPSSLVHLGFSRKIREPHHLSETCTGRQTTHGAIYPYMAWAPVVP